MQQVRGKIWGMIFMAVLVGANFAWADDYGKIKGGQLKVGSEEGKAFDIDVSGKAKFAVYADVKAGDACKDDDAGKMILGNKPNPDQHHLPLVCYQGKWSMVAFLGGANGKLAHCQEGEFLTLNKDYTAVCKAVAVAPVQQEKQGEVPNLICYKTWVKLQSPYSMDCPMAYSLDLTAANDFKSMGTQFSNYKFSLKAWAQNNHLSVPYSTIKAALTQNDYKGSFEKTYDVNPDKVKFPYVILARLKKGVNIGKTLTLTTSNSDRQIVLGSGVNHYSMLIINRYKDKSGYRYEVLGAYFRDTSTNDEFKEGYYRKIRLNEGEVPVAIKVEYDWTGQSDREQIAGVEEDTALIFEFQG